MTSPNLNQSFKVTVNAVSRSGSGASTSFDLLSRAEDITTGSSGRALLSGFSGVGMTVGQDGIPVEQTGTITIRDNHESWGEERRFIDELCEWTPIEQDITIYAGQDTIDTNVAAYETISSMPGFASFLGIYDVHNGAGIDSQNRIAKVDDSTANLNHATQSTDANKPVLTRADNQENLFLQSEDLSTSWSRTRSNITVNAIADPYTGVATVDLIYDDASLANNHYILQTHDILNGVQYRMSAICKRSGRDISFRFDNTGFTANSYAHFNLATGAVTSVSGGATASTPVSLGNGWYYCEAFATAIASATGIALVFYLSSPAGTTVYNGDGASGVYIGRAQLQEVGADPVYLATTTYKQRTGINGNKAAFFDGTDDYLLANGLSTTLSGSDKPFTAIAVVKQAKLSSNQTWFALGRSTSATPLHQLAMTATVNRNIRTDDAALSVTIDSVAPVTTLRILTVVFTGTAATFYINGTAQYTLTAQDVASATFDRAAFGALVKNTVSDYFNGKIPFMAVYNGAMSAADLTVWHAYLTRRYFSTPATTPITYTSIFKGICKSYSKTFDGQTDIVSLNIQSVSFPPARLGFQIGSSIEISSVTYSPDINVGQVLPILFGASVQTAAYRVTTSSTPIYCIASYLKGKSGADFDYYGITQYYARDDAGIYRRISNGSGSTYSYRNHAAGAAYPTPQGMTERAYIFKKTVSGVPDDNSFICVNGRWRFKGQNNGGITPAGYLYFSLYEVEGSTVDASTGAVTDYGRPGKEVATSLRAKADYLTDVRGPSDFWVTFTFDRAVVLKSDGQGPMQYYYAISMRQSEYATDTTDFVDAGGTGSGGTAATTTTRTDRGEWAVVSTPTETPAFELYGLTFAEFSADTVNENGVSVFGIETSTTNEWAAQSNPVVDIDIIVDVPGIRGDGNIFLDGAIITAPDDVANVLTVVDANPLYTTAEWITSPQYNTTAYSTRNAAILDSAAPMRRNVQGAFSGDLDRNQMLALLAKETACKFIQLNDGTIALWAWGYNQASQKVFNQENCKITGLQSADVSSVINNLVLSYDKRLINPSPNLVNEQSGSYYAYQLIYASSLLTQSRAIYGLRDLAQFQFDLVAESICINTLAEYYARMFDHPHQAITLDTPYTEADTLELMDTVTICHPSLPAYYGTASNARIPIYSGAEVTYLVDEYPIRAQPYVGHIVGKSLTWNQGEAPILKLDVWLVQPLHPNAII